MDDSLPTPASTPAFVVVATCSLTTHPIPAANRALVIRSPIIRLPEAQIPDHLAVARGGVGVDENGLLRKAPSGTKLAVSPARRRPQTRDPAQC